jgi:DNA-binding MarR family transcriptional regulator
MMNAGAKRSPHAALEVQLIFTCILQINRSGLILISVPPPETDFLRDESNDNALEKVMLDAIPRKQIDDILFAALQAIYRFERGKVKLFGLTYEQIYLLQYLRRQESISMGHLAVEMQIPLSTATRLIDRMEKRGLVNRRQNPGDKRSREVQIGIAGERLVQAVEDHTFAVLASNLKKHTELDIGGVIQTARQLKDILAIRTNEPRKDS